MRRISILVALTIALACRAATQDCGCASHRTCTACVSAGCNWCADPEKSRGFQGRCTCPGTEFECRHRYPEQILAEEKLLKLSDKEFSNTVQLRPQHIKLKLHVGETAELTLRYKTSEDYPLDLYYLMDSSESMRDVRDRLSTLGADLAEAAKKITSNFHIGFGGFVDKPEEPFYSSKMFNEDPVCLAGKNQTSACIKPYSFKHHMQLGDDAEEFNEKVRAVRLAENLDSPEGTLDAVMQAIVCQKQIGWRENARHMLVVSTGSSFHYGGDGRLLGLVHPNDMKCHLDRRGEYSLQQKYDYPTVAQINLVAKQNFMTVIFVVKENIEEPYLQLQKAIFDSSVQKLSQNNSNLLQVIQMEFDKLMQNVALLDTANSTYLNVQYNSSCLNYNAKTHSCQIAMHQEVEYTITIKAEKCPADRSEMTQQFDIFPPKLRDKLTVEVDMVCECSCDVEGFVIGAPECSHKGSYKCGVCDCEVGVLGSWCQCDAQSDAHLNMTACHPPKTPDSSLPCSGNGLCECGICECNEHYSGEFCQCSDMDCPHNEEGICSGHGTCDCGHCRCATGWNGTLCNCTTTDDLCIPPSGGVPCSGHGSCVCGQCECDLLYSGLHCQVCRTCPGKKCDLYKEYVHHEVFEAECTSEEKCRNPGIVIVQVDRVQVPDEGTEKGMEFCQFLDGDGCYYYFQYTTGNNTVEVQRTKVCEEGVNMLALILGVVGGIVLLGLLLLIAWKVLTTIHDRREFAKFEKERQLAKWDAGGNPLYKNATSTFVNPTFKRD